MSELVLYDRARQAIAEAVRVDEVKSIVDKAVAMKAYARQCKDRQLEVDAAEIRIRAERRLGEMLRAQKDAGGMATGGQPYQSTGAKSEPVDAPPTLADVGIDKKLSSRAQSIAAIPEKQFEATLAEHRNAQSAVSQSTMEKLAKQGEEALGNQAAEKRPHPLGKPEWMSAGDLHLGISLRGWIKTINEENCRHDPVRIARECTPPQDVSTAIREALAAVEWLSTYLEALGGSDV